MKFWGRRKFCDSNSITSQKSRNNSKWVNKLPGFKKKSFTEFINEKNQDLATKEAIDLVSKMLTFDPVTRISAKDALNHAYFNS